MRTNSTLTTELEQQRRLIEKLTATVQLLTCDREIPEYLDDEVKSKVTRTRCLEDVYKKVKEDHLDFLLQMGRARDIAHLVEVIG